MTAEILQIVATTTATVIGAVGGWEAIKYFINRDTNRRKAEAEADSVEFDVLRQASEFMQNQLKEKEERFAAQTELVRKQNIEILELTKEKGRLELELQKYRCIKAKCPHREPANGF